MQTTTTVIKDETRARDYAMACGSNGLRDEVGYSRRDMEAGSTNGGWSSAKHAKQMRSTVPVIGYYRGVVQRWLNYHHWSKLALWVGSEEESSMAKRQYNSLIPQPDTD